MKNPVATMTMKNGSTIVIELMPELAPNTVNSFINLAQKGAFDNHRIMRVEPNFVVDVSTNAFNREDCRYLIENEARKLEAGKRLPPDLGVIGMGGYDGNIAGGEFFFPLTHVERLDGNYPFFGKILEGTEEVRRIGRGPVEKFINKHNPEMKLHRPLNDEVIDTVNIETHGMSYPEPARLEGVELPKHWLDP
jgi:peptidyl-prolyl cis-trans isomerase B (cyclophilin B)